MKQINNQFNALSDISKNFNKLANNIPLSCLNQNNKLRSKSLALLKSYHQSSNSYPLPISNMEQQNHLPINNNNMRQLQEQKCNKDKRNNNGRNNKDNDSIYNKSLLKMNRDYKDSNHDNKRNNSLYDLYKVNIECYNEKQSNESQSNKQLNIHYYHNLNNLNNHSHHSNHNNLNNFNNKNYNHNKQNKSHNNQQTNFNQINNYQLINQQILSFAITQNHIILLNHSNTIHFISINTNTSNSTLSNFINSFFKQQQIIIIEIYSTSYSIFFISQSFQIYALGFNHKGQLGIKSIAIISKPQRITLPTQNYQHQQSTDSNQILWKNNNKIIKITGGPFHTVILTSSNKIYYTGALYGQNQILNDKFISNFTPINIKNQTIKNVECGLTSVIFHTESNKIFIMGLFGDNNFYSIPTDIQIPIKSRIKQISISNDSIYVISQQGNLSKINMTKKIPIITDLKLHQNIQTINKNINKYKYIVQSMHSTFNKIIFILKQIEQSNKSFTYKYFIQQTINSNQFTTKISQINFSNQIIPLKILYTSNYSYVLTLSNNNIQNNISTQRKKNKNYVQPINNYINKIKQLQNQNQKLKQSNNLLTKQKKINSNKKQDKLPVSNINFNFDKEIIPRTFNHDLEIQFSQIKLIKKIAQGGYGIIYKGEWKKTQVAVKIFKIDQNNTNSVKQFISQCRAMQALRHPNIVMFLGACLKRPNFAIVLQYCEGGTLWSLLQNHKIQLFWPQRVSLALQIAKAMNYLHSRKNPIVHRDLKSLNILLDVNRRVKLADFGWTKCLQNYMTSKIGTYQWMAPEVLTGQQYTQKADVFSYSIILWQISSRQPPYRNINGIQVAYDVANKQYRPTIPQNTPIQFKQLIQKCWQQQAQKRPSFIEIIENLQKQLKI